MAYSSFPLLVVLQAVVLATTYAGTSTPATLLPSTLENISSIVPARSTNGLSSSHGSFIAHLPWGLNTTQIWSATSSVTPPPRTTATVTVGVGGQLAFDPSSLSASVGTVIAFNFLGTNHTLTQSELENPCHGNGNFDTGFNQFNPANISGRFVVEYEVKTENSQWFFCAQTAKRAHCQAGMVFSLNPKGMHSRFLSNALAAITLAPSDATLACQMPNPTVSFNNNTLSSLTTASVSARVGVSSTPILPVISNLGHRSVAQDNMMWGVMLAIVIL